MRILGGLTDGRLTDGLLEWREGWAYRVSAAAPEKKNDSFHRRTRYSDWRCISATRRAADFFGSAHNTLPASILDRRFTRCSIFGRTSASSAPTLPPFTSPLIQHWILWLIQHRYNCIHLLSSSFWITSTPPQNGSHLILSTVLFSVDFFTELRLRVLDSANKTNSFIIYHVLWNISQMTGI